MQIQLPRRVSIVLRALFFALRRPWLRVGSGAAFSVAASRAPCGSALAIGGGGRGRSAGHGRRAADARGFERPAREEPIGPCRGPVRSPDSKPRWRSLLPASRAPRPCRRVCQETKGGRGGEVRRRLRPLTAPLAAWSPDSRRRRDPPLDLPPPRPGPPTTPRPPPSPPPLRGKMSPLESHEGTHVSGGQGSGPADTSPGVEDSDPVAVARTCFRSPTRGLLRTPAPAPLCQVAGLDGRRCPHRSRGCKGTGRPLKAR